MIILALTFAAVICLIQAGNALIPNPYGDDR